MPTETKQGFLQKHLPFWPGLTAEEQGYLVSNTRIFQVKEGQMVHSVNDECLGVLLIESGRLRAYLMSAEGREITLYSMGHGAVSMLAAACILKNAELPVSLEAEEDSLLYVIPPNVYNHLRKNNLEVEHYISEMLAASFAMTLTAVKKAVFLTVEQRLAVLLLQQAALEQSCSIHLTQEEMARQLGTAREVVSRLLKQFSSQSLLRVFRGGVEILDKETLALMAPEEV